MTPNPVGWKIFSGISQIPYRTTIFSTVSIWLFVCCHSSRDIIDAIFCRQLHAFQLLCAVDKLGNARRFINISSLWLRNVVCRVNHGRSANAGGWQWTTDHDRDHASAISIWTGGDLVIFIYFLYIAVHYIMTFLHCDVFIKCNSFNTCQKLTVPKTLRCEIYSESIKQGQHFKRKKCYHSIKKKLVRGLTCSQRFAWIWHIRY